MAAVAAQVVRDLSPTPVLDVIEAGALSALAATRSRRIGVIGTPTTINSNAYARAIHSIEPDARLTSQACALLVPLAHVAELSLQATTAVVDPGHAAPA